MVGLNPNFILLSILVFLFAILIFQWDNIKNKLSRILFSRGNNKKSKYICPKCGSDDWKFPNPIKPAESTINIYNLVNQFLECKNCGHIGIFFAVGENTAINPIKEEIKNKNYNKIRLTPLGWGYITFIFIIALSSPSLLWTVIIFMAGMSLINKRGLREY